MIAVIFPIFASSILCISLPFLGEKIRIDSSLHPLMIYLPFFGKCSDKQMSLGTEILMVGARVLVFHITISPPEQVPNISEKSFRKATVLILVEWQA
jgi:hypothetical protein